MLFKYVKFLFFIFLITIFSCKDNTVVKIGLIADLKSDKSRLGITGRNGVILAIDEINKLGGINGQQVELISISHDGKKDRAYSAVKDLVSQGCKLIIGPFLSSMAQPVQISALNENVLVISPTVGSSKFTGKDDNFLRLMPNASEQGVFLYSAIKFNGDKNIAIIMDESNSEYVHDVSHGLYEASKDGDIKISEIFFKSSFEVEMFTNYILEGNFDGLLFVTNSLNASNIIKYYGDNSSIPNIYGTAWLKNSYDSNFNYYNLDGMLVTDCLDNDIPNIKEIDFFRKYYDKHSSIPNTSAKYSYEAINLYKQIIEGHSDYTFKDIKNIIVNLENIDGISESYTLDHEGDVIRDFTLYKIIDGEFRLFNIIK